MRTLTITIPTGKNGNVAYFTLNVKTCNFLSVVDNMENISTIDELQLGELNGLYEIQK